MLNLSRIKKVGFIDNFNPKKSYPEFGIKTKTAVVIAKVSRTKKAINAELKEAKKEFKASIKPNYKPQLLVRSSLW